MRLEFEKAVSVVKRLLAVVALVGCGGSGPTEGSRPVASIVVEPSTADVLVGQETLFSARTFAADGSQVFGAPVQWSVGNQTVASVDAGWARGLTSGTSSLTARSGNVSGSATVNVVTNEPAGFTRILELTFSDPTWQTSLGQGWDMLLPPTVYQNCGAGDGTGDNVCIDPETVNDHGFPHPPVGQHTLPQDFGDKDAWPGSAGRSGGTRMSYSRSRVKEIYASFRVRFDSAFTMEGGGGFKVLGLMVDRPGGSAVQGLWINAHDGAPVLRLSANQKQYNASGSNTPVVTYGGDVFPVGEVLFVEVYAKMNTIPNAPDGLLQVWVNGSLRVNRSDVIWFEEMSVSPQWFSGVKWDPIPNVRFPAPENWVRMDDIYASGR